MGLLMSLTLGISIMPTSCAAPLMPSAHFKKALVATLMAA